MPKYETTGGHVTRGDTYAQLREHLIRCEELAYVMAHLHNTEDSQMDKLLAQGWLGMGELFKRTTQQVTQLAMNKLQ